jgi:hypothetical protein
MTTPFPEGVTTFFQKGSKTHVYPGDILIVGVTATSEAVALNGKVSHPNAKRGNKQTLPRSRWEILS